MFSKVPQVNVSRVNTALDMHFIHSTTREIQIYFRSFMANSKTNFKLLCAKL